YLEEVIIFQCDEITSAGLASAIRERPTLRSLSFSNMETSKVFTTSQFIDSLVGLKGLTCLVLQYLSISDELLYSIAREGVPLTRLDLHSCNGYSNAGIFYLLSKYQRIQHLNLEGADYLNDQHVVQLSSFLGDLVSINLSGCREITYSALFALAKNCSSLNEIKMERIGSNIVGNSDSDSFLEFGENCSSLSEIKMESIGSDVGHSENLVDFGVYPQLKSLYLGNNSW
ncbi:F-box/LRR-repeat protein, partial [Trifolium medium]|nr:F-box/LRR-repeat protein [Trifolium medium]